MGEQGIVDRLSWVAVTDRKPAPYTAVVGWSTERDQYVIVAVSDVAFGGTGKFYDQRFDDRDDITHWLPLPEPPVPTDEVGVGASLKADD